jgi:hypothetical protein
MVHVKTLKLEMEVLNQVKLVFYLMYRFPSLFVVDTFLQTTANTENVNNEGALYARKNHFKALFNSNSLIKSQKEKKLTVNIEFWCIFQDRN